MRQVVVPGTDLAVSRFVFGTAALFSVGRTGERRRLLEAAAAAGFSHFDTAPYYGFGTAERDLRPVLAADPRLTVTTKVGIYSAGGEEQAAWSVLLRKAAGKAFAGLSRPTVDWSVERARLSLEGSLRRLGRSAIDLYMLHEPVRHLLVADEWLRWLDTEVQSGRVRRFGLALDARQVKPFLAAPTRLNATIQTFDSLEGREADALPAHGHPLQITYGYVSAALAQGRPAADIPAILAAALTRNTAGAVIVSTRRIGRLAQFARLAGG